MSFKETLGNIKKNISTIKKTGSGPSEEANHGWRDPKPYSQVWNNGVFEGYDTTLWKYWANPVDVKINWTKNPGEILENQSFFIDIMKEVGKALDGQTERTKNDLRRKFHIVLTQDLYAGIPIYPDCTPAHADYLRRASKEIVKGQWFGYTGFQVHESNFIFDGHSLSSMVSKLLEFWREPDEMQYEFYRQDMRFLDETMSMRRFRELRFDEINEETQLPGERDLEQLTAWYGVSDRKFGMSRNLESTRFQEPIHGKSVIVPKSWRSDNNGQTEIMFSAIRPKIDSGMFMTDPQSNFAQFITKPMQPNSKVVSISIRGEIRSGRVADNFLEQKSERKTGKRNGKGKQVDLSYNQEIHRDVSKIETARGQMKSGVPFFDNLEIVVGQIVDGEENKLPSMLRDHGLEAVPLVNRQPEALLNTLPTYPHQIHRIRSGNSTRSVMTNQMLPGVLAFSGIYRSTKPAEPFGIFLGHDDSNTDFREIYTSVEAAKRENNVPGFLISGRPGSGKTQTMLQIVEQGHYQGYSVFFMNPKKESTLQPVFDHLGGATISMSTKFLMDNPGCFDAIIFFDALVPNSANTIKAQRYMRMKAAETISSAIFTGLKWNHNDENMIEMQTRLSTIRSQIQHNAMNLGNTCAAHVIFGNEETNTQAIRDEDVIEYVRSSIDSTAFWKAFIAESASVNSKLQEQMMSNRAVLMEWDGSLRLPGQRDNPKNYGAEQIESLLSVQIAFIYASSILGNGKTGGILAADESWVFKSSPEITALLDTGFREWRQLNVLMLMGTQNISDWMGQGGISDSDMSSFFSRILMMAVNEQSSNELDLFFQFSQLPRTTYYERYIIDAGIDKKRRPGQPPRGYYIDNISKYRGPIILGPYPELEMSLGRTDKEGEEARRLKALEEEESDHGLLGGGLADIFAVNEDMSQKERLDSSPEGLSGESGKSLIKEPVLETSTDGSDPNNEANDRGDGVSSVQTSNDSRSLSSYDNL